MIELDGLSVAVALFVAFCLGLWIGVEACRRQLLTRPRASVDPIRVRLRLVRGRR